jgi:hypothetical protein
VKKNIVVFSWKYRLYLKKKDMKENRRYCLSHWNIKDVQMKSATRQYLGTLILFITYHIYISLFPQLPKDRISIAILMWTCVPGNNWKLTMEIGSYKVVQHPHETQDLQVITPQEVWNSLELIIVAIIVLLLNWNQTMLTLNMNFKT